MFFLEKVLSFGPLSYLKIWKKKKKKKKTHTHKKKYLGLKVELLFYDQGFLGRYANIFLHTRPPISQKP